MTTSSAHPTQTAIDAIQALRRDLRDVRPDNEADTRHRLIDAILHQLLSWPRNRIRVESYTKPGFADYVLVRENEDQLLFLEAKREGIFFELPRPANPSETSCYIPLSRLLSNPDIARALNQVREYCLNSGCEFGGITNGHEWVLFKTFEKGRKWEQLQGFVIRSVDFFEVEYTRAFNALSYGAIVDGSSLSILLSSAPPKDRAIYYAKDSVPSYSHPIQPNRLASLLRPIATRYFGVIDDEDREFMNRCYVSQRDYEHAVAGMRDLIQDSLSPYFMQFNVRNLTDTGKGGQIGGKLKKNIQSDRRGEVLVLFGGKGAGKSTFIKRLLHHNPPPWLRQHSVAAIIDLLTVPEDRDGIRSAIWSRLVSSIDREGLLAGQRDELIVGLFKDRFEVALRQELAGLPRGSEVFNTRLNDLVVAWKQDHVYCARQIVSRLRERLVGIIVVIDNTDQYTGATQDFCFAAAQEIADQLGCITLISMREERFYNSKAHGLLDAFQNSGFHISSPRPSEVFKRRLAYVISILADSSRRKSLLANHGDKAFESQKYLEIILSAFSDHSSPLNRFLSACAHGDTRLALDLFRSFLLSGYTNVEEMLAAGRWEFQIHQVLKPVMIPTRFFYDEKLSDIPNILQLRDNRQSSHFTTLRILRKLAKHVDGAAAGYVPVAQLKSYFATTFHMLEDFANNMDILLKKGFIEADNRLDAYSDSVDRVKITSYGMYAYNTLAFEFSYLDLVCTDCGVFNEELSNYIAEAAKEEYQLFLKHERLKRVELRLERAGRFVEYLNAEERRERELYRLGFPDEELFTARCVAAFEAERDRVLASAKRNSSPNSKKSRGRRAQR